MDLRKTRNYMGLYELRRFRHEVWQKAVRFNQMEYAEYMQEPAAWEEAIARVQLINACTDWAFDVAVGLLIPGSTAAVWAVQQLKPAFLSFWEVVTLSPDGMPTMEMLTQWCKKSLTASLGSADGLFAFPEMPKAGTARSMLPMASGC